MDHHEAIVEDRMEKFARDHPGGVFYHRLWFQRTIGEMHHILQFTDRDESWTATGTSLGLAYCELRRKMEMGE
jgi:hypothetical protein